ncbi:hypothetical protein [Taibaiella koreensis]|uniref:hypothetical protein n=1 Tax=Taibaiella koreensis TaxID=1268548 RepID=UPI000E59FB0B|nr:hypothetical protein [Taibaiella koreensis]
MKPPTIVTTGRALPYLITGLMLLYACLTANAQPPAKTVRALEHYDRYHAPESLYLHLDKTTYLPEESIWFTAYSLEPADSNRNTLFVLLQHIATDSILTSARFVLEQGIAKGHLYLPSRLPEGAYRLISYTNNQLSYPDKILSERWIRVLKTKGREWQLKERDGMPATRGNRHFQLIQPDLSTAAGKTLHYRLMQGNRLRQQGTRKTTATGDLILELPDSLLEEPLQLEAILKTGKETSYLSTTVNLPIPLITCYPESGNLLEGHDCKVAFEIGGNISPATPQHGEVRENGKPVARLHFITGNSGSFHLAPKYGATYTIHTDAGLDYKVQFPPVGKEGYALHTGNSTAGDSLELKIYAAGTANDLYVVLHNFKDILYSTGIRFSGREGRMTIPLQHMAPGLVAATLTDLQGNPLAERCIYIPPEQQDLAIIGTDSTVYQSRSAIKIKVRLTDNLGLPAKGYFSLGVVSSPLYDSLLAPSLPDYYYAGRHFPSAVLSSLANLDNERRDLALLTCFRSHSWWQDNPAAHTAPAGMAQGISGKVLYEMRPPKVPLDYLIAADTQVRLRRTDSSGHFFLGYADLTGPYGSFLYLSPIQRKKYSYIHGFRLSTDADALEQFNHNMAARAHTFPPLRDMQTSPLTDQGYRLYLDKMIQLQEVEITGRRHSDPIDALKEQYRMVGDNIFIGDCGRDYICMFHFDESREGLNIPWINCAHGTGLRPVDGEYYFYPGPPLPYRKAGLVKYIGCPDTTRGKFLALLRATWQDRAFYSATPEMQAVPGYIPVTTLLWEHLVMTDDRGEAEIRCFANDISGRFLIHLQGFTSHGPVSGQQYFYVNNAR